MSEPVRLARLHVFDSFAAAENLWRDLGKSGVHTPFQRYDFVAEWQRSVGAQQGASPLAIVAFDALGRPMMLLPLIVQEIAGVRIARFPGGKHSTFNMAIFDREFAGFANEQIIRELVELIRKTVLSVDLIMFERQPYKWSGASNPLAFLPWRPSADQCPSMSLETGSLSSAISGSFRGRLRTKERKLERLPGYRYTVASSGADVARLLNAFFAIKPLRMAQQKLPDVFAEPGVEEFVRAACAPGIADGKPAIEIHALECDEEVIAIFAGVADGCRFSMMFNTYTMSQNAKHSPGLVLLRSIVDYYASRGFASLDLGIGTGDYKRLFCKDEEPLFDACLSLTRRGWIAAAGISAANRAKLAVRKSPLLMKLVREARHRLSRGRPASLHDPGRY